MQNRQTCISRLRCLRAKESFHPRCGSRDVFNITVPLSVKEGNYVPSLREMCVHMHKHTHIHTQINTHATSGFFIVSYHRSFNP